MRDLKFRQWKDERMTEFGFLKDKRGNISFTSAQSSLIDKYPAMQFTGLTDKNDVEIYEGDIVNKDGKVCEVVFSKKAAKFCVRLPSKQWHGVVNKVYSISGCEVIGNIYENPKLL